jgi:hypothetical protein
MCAEDGAKEQTMAGRDSLERGDRTAERTNLDIAGRPLVVRGSTQLLFSGMRRFSENTAINTKNKSHSVTAELEIPSRRLRGGRAVSPDYGPRDNTFSGKVNWVQIDVDAAAKDVDHLIGAEERFQLMMMRQ